MAKATKKGLKTKATNGKPKAIQPAPVSLTNERILASNQNLSRFVENASWSRQQFLNAFLDPRRDINKECGFPDTPNIRIEDYRELYDREAIATRVVDIWPDECWLVQPSVFEEEDDNETEFETAWANLSTTLRGGSKFQADNDGGSPVWEALHRIDRLSGVGSYGVLLLGFDDGLELREEVVPKKGMELIYLRTFDESQATIVATENDVNSPRFGQPIKYNITFNDPRNSSQATSVQAGDQTADDWSGMTKEVHWTRVIHVADNLNSSEVFGIPRMRPVYNNILSLRKVVHGSGEMFWKGAFPGLSLETVPQLGPTPEVDKSALKDMVENYQNGLQRYLALIGMQAKSLAPQVADPTDHYDIQIRTISIKGGYPKRVFEGSELGELSSSEDTKRWNGRLQGRRNNHITPRIIVPFADRLIKVKVLPEPESYTVVWPDQESLTDAEKATIAKLRAETIAVFVQSSSEAMMVPVDFYTRVMSMSDEEAEEVVENATKAIDEDPLTGRLDPEPVDPLSLIEAKGAIDVDRDAAKFGQAQTAKKAPPFGKSAKKQPVPKKAKGAKGGKKVQAKGKNA